MSIIILLLAHSSKLYTILLLTLESLFRI